MAWTGGVIGVIQGMRPHQWTKNVLVFVAPAAAGVISHRSGFLHSLAAFGIFCAAASGLYLANDAADHKADRLHPVKRNRPVARGDVSPLVASGVGFVLIAVAMVSSWFVARGNLVIVMGVYIAISLSYSLGLKRAPVLELGAVASGYLMRAIAGGVATHVPLSSWFLAVASFGALFVVTGKRLGEHLRFGDDGHLHRDVLGEYTASFLRSTLTLTASVTVTAYCLWAFERTGMVPGGGHHFVWIQLSVIPVLLGMLHMLRLVDAGLVDAPEELVFRDRVLQGLGVVWIVLFAIGIYG
ncbi:MAG TPA: decaprenyl-phosphate phosphoribosyltransferase [Acidimicrobiales bacterium]|nr:decaprenyl-phosphate phosphoribosyltransferase [Acidimicrobiales bacterium]